jgi:hypothetical protein
LVAERVEAELIGIHLKSDKLRVERAGAAKYDIGGTDESLLSLGFE